MRKLFFVAVAFACGTAQAQQMVGDWIVSSMEGGHFAASKNDSGGFFGKYCYTSTDTCYWLMSSTLNCKEGAQIPVLVNASSGAATVKVGCVPVGGTPRYVFLDHDLMDQLTTEGQQIGFALPTESGQFRVTRFNINRTPAALSALRQLITRKPTTSGRTKDFSL